MREILFRGKRIDNGEWVYGNLNYGTIEIKSIKDSYYISNFDVNPWDKKFYPVIRESVEQYTGLTDKNGKKIFEGDIVMDSDFPETKYTVGFFEGAFVAKNDNGEIFYLREFEAFGESEIEVIGNIHDNPELLEAVE